MHGNNFLDDDLYPVSAPQRDHNRLSTEDATAAPCTVTTVADSGQGSLRQCLLQAKAGTTITFTPQIFPLTAPATIMLASPLPMIITDTLTIDGSNAGVILNGKQLSQGAGLLINGAAGVVVRGLQILSFPWDGVALINNARNAVIGGDRAVGAARLGQGNLISGNGRAGIWLEDPGTTGNQIAGNYIGATESGLQGLGNGVVGVALRLGVHHNTIGGLTADTGNLISANRDLGIYIADPGTTANQIVGNFIGVNGTGLAALGNGIYGILIEAGASNNSIGGEDAGARNLISGNGDSGLYLDQAGTTGNQIVGNYIGVDATGSRALPNGGDGILISAGVQGTIVGGTTAGARNVISGNRETGIQLQGDGAINNRVQGNYIGVDLTGRVAISNTEGGISLIFGASNNQIGGETPGAGNVISGNGNSGIHLQNSGTAGNQIQGNKIGVDSTGKAAVGNGMSGILVIAGAANNLIGGESTGARNLISGNGLDGIALEDAGTSSNRILGNFIGTDVDGLQSLANGENGIGLLQAKNNRIGGESTGARNLISGNIYSGVKIQGADATDNRVLGNFIGVNVSGAGALGNGEAGVALLVGANHNIIGSETTGARNLISGNAQYGVILQDINTSHNQISGNYIGVDVTGAQDLGNGERGILLISGPSNNFIGNETAGAGNLVASGAPQVISGNDLTGIALTGAGTNQNEVKGNIIGADVTGSAAVGNGEDGIVISNGASQNIIGGTTPGARNLIAGNGDDGIYLQDAGTIGNQILGNWIGVDASGQGKLSNGGDGVLFDFGASHNIVGGTTADARNIISGNNQNGLWLQSQNAPAQQFHAVSNNQILGNYIGVDTTGAQAVGNGKTGITLSAGATANFIGGEASGAGNVISGNDASGIWLQGECSQTVIKGNYIGVDSTGKQRLGNQGDGITLIEGANNNIIGGTSAGARNIISGNSETGILLHHPNTVGNEMLGNYIGVDVDGVQAISNTNGILLAFGANNNLVGGSTDGAGNLISGNKNMGVQIHSADTTNNHVVGNRIGVNFTGAAALGNGVVGVGVGLGAGRNTIGISNTIAYNGKYGVAIEDATMNTITRNAIHHNGMAQIKWITQPPSTGPVPIANLESYSQDQTLQGSACSGCRVEVFANPDANPAGTRYMGAVNADSAGIFTLRVTLPLELSFLSTTTTDSAGTTSEFSPGLDTTPIPSKPYRVWLPSVLRS